MKTKTRNIYFMYAIAFLQGMVFYGPVATLYRQVRGISVLQITIIESISLALCLLLEFPWGILADKIGYKKTLLICNGLFFLSKIVFWQATGFPAFLMERMIISIVIAGLSGVDTALLYLSCEGDGLKNQKFFTNELRSFCKYCADTYGVFGTQIRENLATAWGIRMIQDTKHPHNRVGKVFSSLLAAPPIRHVMAYFLCIGVRIKNRSQHGVRIKSRSQHVFGIYNSLGTAGLLATAFLFSTSIGNNYSLAAFLTVISYGIAALLSFGLVEVDTKKEGHNFHSLALLLKQTLTDKYLLLFLIGIALLNETHQTITVFLNQLQYVKCGLSPSAIGCIYIAVTIAGLCGALSSKITEKLGIAPTAALLFTVAAISCTILSFTSNAYLSVFGILLLRIAFSLFQPLQEELQNRRITDGNRATALSVNAVVIDSIGAGANIAFGRLAEHSLAHSFLFGAALCAIGGFFFYVWYRRAADQ